MEIGIIGSGAMGSGIAQVAATAGHAVALYDSRREALDQARNSLRKNYDRLAEKGKMVPVDADAAFDRIRFCEDLEALRPAGLVIEAIIEDEGVKKAVFRQLDALLSPDAVIASNTSSLSIASLASACSRPERFIGLHFFNPAPLMPLVEVIPALQTAPDLPGRLVHLMQSWGKAPVLAKDTPGFIVNRIARPYYGEAIRILEEGLATAPQIDRVMRERGGFRMGPFELMDFIGHDVNHAVTESVWKACYHEPRYQPSFTQRRLVDAGWLGRKTGRGFYTYGTDAVPPVAEPLDEATETRVYERILAMLINEAADAWYWGIADATDIDRAMTLGVNYPKGLLRWADEWGIATVETVLDRLYHFYHDPRYRCSPGLRQKSGEGDKFHPESSLP